MPHASASVAEPNCTFFVVEAKRENIYTRCTIDLAATLNDSII